MYKIVEVVKFFGGEIVCEFGFFFGFNIKIIVILDFDGWKSVSSCVCFLNFLVVLM